MSTALQSRPLAYRFHDLPSLTQEEVRLWNWLCRIGPRREEWSSWVADILGHLVQRLEGVQIRLVQSHALEADFGEKNLAFGSKSNLLIGRDSEADVVLSAQAISKHHARLTVVDNRAYLEDLGGKLGTYLWDKRLSPHEPQALSDGDQFSVFPYRFRVILERSWSPEKGISLGKPRVYPLQQRDFLAMSPLGWHVLGVDCHPSTEALLLTVNPLFMAELRQRILAPLGLAQADMSVPSDDVILAFAMLAVLERLNRRIKSPLRFSLPRDKHEPAKSPARGMLVSAPVTVGGLSTELRAFLPFEMLSNSMPDPEPEQHLQYPEGLCWTFPISSAFVDLLPDEVAQVGIGDLLIVESAPKILFPNDFDKGWSFSADPSNTSSLAIDKYFERSVQVEPVDETISTGTKVDLSTLPVRLHVIVGQREFTVAEINSLSPGTIVELQTEKLDPVRLMVNGKILGEGELVDVDGRLAVKVLGWRTA